MDISISLRHQIISIIPFYANRVATGSVGNDTYFVGIIKKLKQNNSSIIL